MRQRSNRFSDGGISIVDMEFLAIVLGHCVHGHDYVIKERDIITILVN